jgi:hypothetical protein
MRTDLSFHVFIGLPFLVGDSLLARRAKHPVSLMQRQLVFLWSEADNLFLHRGIP